LKQKEKKAITAVKATLILKKKKIEDDRIREGGLAEENKELKSGSEQKTKLATLVRNKKY